MAITLSSLLTKPAYALYRHVHRADMIAYRQTRSLQFGPHAMLYFEDERTVRYQIQEMLRAEGIEDEAGRREQIDLYKPLLPNGRNWKATLMWQIPEPSLRRNLLPQLARIASYICRCPRTCANTRDGQRRSRSSGRSSLGGAFPAL